MNKIIVAKFGGTSMKDAPAMERSATIALEHKAQVVVVSATSGTTDQLVQLGELALQKSWPTCSELIGQIKKRHHKIANENDSSQEIHEAIDSLIEELKTIAKGVYFLKDLTPKANDNILSIGERLSSLIITETFRHLSPSSEVIYLDARKVVKTDNQYGKAGPLIEEIAKACTEYMPFSDNRIYVTQGFIGSTMEGKTTTLGRGGSDYSAALIAEGCKANVLQIWTDVAGIATTDPRICKEARSIKELSYLEASEMAQYGAKILHPNTIVPAMRSGMDVFVGSSYDKQGEGTWIRKSAEKRPALRAIAKRSNQSLLIVRTPEMLYAYGFLQKIFRIFGQHKISVDCVTTSEISVAVSVDRAVTSNQELIKDLKDLGEVIVEDGLALISIIGNQIHQTMGIGFKVFDALQGINVRMVCLGASEHNFCILVSNNQVDEAICKLHTHFIDGDSHEVSVAG